MLRSVLTTAGQVRGRPVVADGDAGRLHRPVEQVCKQRLEFPWGNLDPMVGVPQREALTALQFRAEHLPVGTADKGVRDAFPAAAHLLGTGDLLRCQDH